MQDPGRKIRTATEDFDIGLEIHNSPYSQR